jgi:hypothetical protein
LRNFTIPGVSKFSHPVFGNGRVYISTNQGYLYGFGSPVKNVLNCSSPYNLGVVPINTVTQPVTITCTALNQTTIQSIILSNATEFQISGSPSLPLSLSTGQSFTFKATSSPSNVGTVSKDVVISVQNVVPGYFLEPARNIASHRTLCCSPTSYFPALDNIQCYCEPAPVRAAYFTVESWRLSFDFHEFQLLSSVTNWTLDSTQHYFFWSEAGRRLHFQWATAHNGAWYICNPRRHVWSASSGK